MTDLFPIFEEIGTFAGGLPVSYSRAQTLLRCPLSFILKYQEGVRECGTLPVADDTRVGSLAHKIMEESVNSARANGISIPGSCFEEHFRRWWNEASTQFQRDELLRIKAPMRESLKKVLSLVKRFGDCRNQSPRIFTERKLEMCRDGKVMDRGGERHTQAQWKSRAFTGVVDAELLFLPEEKLVIIDYKTEYPSDIRAVQVEMQMALYAYGELRGRSSLNSVSTYVMYLKNAQAVKIGEYSRDDLESLDEKVVGFFNEYLNALKKVERVATPHPYCKYCGYRGAYCKEWNQMEDSENGENAKEQRDGLGKEEKDMGSGVGDGLVCAASEDCSAEQVGS